MPHKLGLHWQKTHYERDVDMPHFAAMGYHSYTLFGESWDNKQLCDDLLATASPDAIFLLRDHPLSEQKEACISDPAGTGVAHALAWAKKRKEGQVHIPPERSYHLGINELDTNQYQRQNDIYTTNFAKALAANGMKCAGWSFGVGHPSTKNLDPHLPPDWSWYKESAETLIRLGGIAAIHEYWLPGNYNWGNWLGRYMQHCPYNVRYVVKESFYDSGLEGRFPNQGYMWYINESDPTQINHFLGEINGAQSRLSQDPRFHSLQGFTYDFAKPWGSFDIKPIRKYFEAFPWTLASEQETTRLPIIGGGTRPPSAASRNILGLPLSGPYQITQRFAENPQDYERFGQPGHNGVDYAPTIDPSLALSIADGQVQWVGTDPDYGNYVRILHPQLGFHSFYAHLNDITPGLLHKKVKKGDSLGFVGSTGNSTGRHLHLEIRLAHPDGTYKEGTYGYGKGRVDPQTVFEVLNHA